jgi:hypothetical protein
MDIYRLFRPFQKVSLSFESSSLESQEPKAVPNKKDTTPTITAPAEIIFDFLLMLRLQAIVRSLLRVRNLRMVSKFLATIITRIRYDSGQVAAI